jgi:hypothetical protein
MDQLKKKAEESILSEKQWRIFPEIIDSELNDHKFFKQRKWKCNVGQDEKLSPKMEDVLEIPNHFRAIFPTEWEN